MSVQTNPIAVVGAGIGGLAAALFLSRAGFEVSLVEKRTRVEEEGAGLQLSPNASRILIEAGMGPALSRRASAPERVRIRRAADGRELAAMPLGQEIKKRHGAPYLRHPSGRACGASSRRGARRASRSTALRT